jgi:hypothetical protein
MKLGNIIYSSELINHEKVDYIHYHDINVINDSKLINYNKLPTLIVGFSSFKKLYGDRFPDQSVLDKTVIPNKLYWEFSFAENKKQNTEGLEAFVNERLVGYYFFDFQYINIDPIFLQLKNEETLFKLFEIVDCVYIDNRMIYVVSSNKVHGIDMDVFDFYGFNVSFIKNTLLEKAIKRVIDLENTIFRSYYKKFPELDYLKRYIPLFELIK